MPSERTYGGKSFAELDDFWSDDDNAEVVVVSLVARVRELESDLARVTAERDARVVLPEMESRNAVCLTRTSNGIYVAEWFRQGDECFADHMETGPTPAAALEALRKKMEEHHA